MDMIEPPLNKNIAFAPKGAISSSLILDSVHYSPLILLFQPNRSLLLVMSSGDFAPTTTPKSTLWFLLETDGHKNAMFEAQS